MQVSTAFTDHTTPYIILDNPQNVHEGDMFDHEGVSELSLHPELMTNNITLESWENLAPSDEEIVRTTTQIAENIQQDAGTVLAANRTRSGRRVNQPAIQHAGAVATRGLAAPIKAATRKRKRQNRQVNIVCTGCYRGNSPSNNFIVLCDACDAPWHQKCHNPNIDNEVIEIPAMKWFCIKCNPKQRQTVQIEPRNKAAAKGKKAGYPKEQLVSEHAVGGSHYSEQERQAYLSSLSHDSLVQLLMKVSNKWPSVPMFPPNMEPVTDFTSSPLTGPHNNQAPNFISNAVAGPTLVGASTFPANILAMDTTTIVPDADKLLAEMVSEAAPFPPSQEPLGGMTTGHGFLTTSHGHPAPTVSTPGPSARTNLQNHTTTVLKFTPQAENTAQPARKASLVFWNSDLLTEDELSYSPSRPQSLTPFVSRSSQVESHHGSEFDPEDYRAYPEPGKGFRLPLTSNDLDILAEKKDCLTFSHSIRGSPRKVQNKTPLSSFGEQT